MVKLTYQLIMMMNGVLIQIQAGQFAVFFARFDGSQITFNRTGHPLHQLHAHVSRSDGKSVLHAYVLKRVLNYFGNCFYWFKQ